MKRRLLLVALSVLGLAMPALAQEGEPASEESKKKGLTVTGYVGGGLEFFYKAGPWDNTFVDAGIFLGDVNLEVTYGIPSKSPVGKYVAEGGFVHDCAITSSWAGYFGIKAYTWKCVDATVRVGAVGNKVAVSNIGGEVVKTTNYMTSRLGLKLDIKPWRMIAFTLEPEYVLPLRHEIFMEEIQTESGLDKLQTGIDIKLGLNICF